MEITKALHVCVLGERGWGSEIWTEHGSPDISKPLYGHNCTNSSKCYHLAHLMIIYCHNFIDTEVALEMFIGQTKPQKNNKTGKLA